MKRRSLGIICLVVLALLTYGIISNLEQEMETQEVLADEEILDISLGLDEHEELREWGFDETEAFFVEYRLQRDRVREEEREMLMELINNPNASAEAKENAEKQMMQIVDVIEKELLVENLLRAQGYEDALFFYRNQQGTVMIKSDELSEREFAQVADIVAKKTDTPREEVEVIVHE